MKRNTKTLLCVLCAVAAVLCVVFACFMLTKKQSGTTASSAASGASVSVYGKVSDFDYASFAYFDIKILEREGAAKEFPAEIVAKVEEMDKTMTEEQKHELVDLL